METVITADLGCGNGVGVFDDGALPFSLAARQLDRPDLLFVPQFKRVLTQNTCGSLHSSEKFPRGHSLAACHSGAYIAPWCELSHSVRSTLQIVSNWRFLSHSPDVRDSTARDGTDLCAEASETSFFRSVLGAHPCDIHYDKPVRCWFNHIGPHSI